MVCNLPNQSEVVSVLIELQNKLDQINEIEERVVALCEMIKGLRVIVQGQSLVVDSISQTFERISNYVEESTKSLEEAKENSISIQEKMCCVFFVFLLVSIVGMNWLLNHLVFGK